VFWKRKSGTGSCVKGSENESYEKCKLYRYMFRSLKLTATYATYAIRETIGLLAHGSPGRGHLQTPWRRGAAEKGINGKAGTGFTYPWNLGPGSTK